MSGKTLTLKLSGHGKSDLEVGHFDAPALLDAAVSTCEPALQPSTPSHLQRILGQKTSQNFTRQVSSSAQLTLDEIYRILFREACREKLAGKKRNTSDFRKPVFHLSMEDKRKTQEAAAKNLSHRITAHIIFFNSHLRERSD